MSFSSEHKVLIMQQPTKNACCRKAILDGILSSRATVEDKNVSVRLENDALCDFTVKLINEFCGRIPEGATLKNGGRCRVLNFSSKTVYKYLTNVKSGENELYQTKCDGCTGAFFRGFFLACGTLSDPKKQNMLEFSPIDNHDTFISALEINGIKPSVSVRNNKKRLYYKKSENIVDFLALVGMNASVFDILNLKIKKEINNNINRVFNCEMQNISRTVSAARKQIDVIEALRDADLLSSLPEELERTARLRLEHADFSLAQLSAISIPPISKSGLAHRLNKIMELAEQLLSGK